mmetsp:Transcript_65618/g.182510  ORF Transcript_65618/g.182510 Transcript_65618/m.182510 type:complete len:539 (+) Transcript_65618:122-1738(+)
MAAPSLSFTDITLAIDKRLFVGRVPPGTTDQELSEVFSIYGILKECQVKPVPGTAPGSHHIGFVAYESWSAAHRALMETDGRQKLRGHESGKASLVVSFAEKTQNVGRGGGAAYAKGLDVNRVFVGSLPADCVETELGDCFSIIGDIQEIKLLPPKRRFRCAYVTFATWGQAMDAVENFHLKPIRASAECMTVTLAEPPNNPRLGGRQSTTSAVIPPPITSPVTAVVPPAKRRRVDGVGQDMESDVELQQMLAAYSAAAVADGPRAPIDALHEQIMQHREAAQHAVQAPMASWPPTVGVWADKTAVGGWVEPQTEGSWNDRPAGGLRSEQPVRKANASGDRLFIGGLPHDIEEDELAALAGQVEFSLPSMSSELIECRVLAGRGCGYLRYATTMAAQEAMKALHMRHVTGWQQPLRVEWAAPPREKGTTDPLPVKKEKESEPIVGPTTQADVESRGLDPKRLFVGQISRDAHAGTVLRPIFEQYGAVHEWNYVESKGVLYITYPSFEEAQDAKLSLNGQVVPGASRGLNIHFSQLRRS